MDIVKQLYTALRPHIPTAIAYVAGLLTTYLDSMLGVSKVVVTFMGGPGN